MAASRISISSTAAEAASSSCRPHGWRKQFTLGIKDLFVDESHELFLNRRDKFLVCDQKNLPPFTEYGHISQPDWDTFVADHTTAEALALRKKMSELAKKNRYPHRLGSSGYAGHVDQWRETEQRFAAAGKPLLVDPMVERSKNWVWARSTGQVSDEGDILFETPDIEQVTTNLQQIVEKERAGQFVPRRERDQLTVALGTAEHSGRVRGLSSKPSWKIGFPHDAPSYKKRDKYKEQLSYKIYAQVKEHFYSLVAKNPTAFPRLFPDGQQPTQSTQQTTNAPSSVGSVETTPFPMDGITGPTPCSLVVPIGRARKTKEVATGLAIPGCQLHNTAIPEDYARVQVAKVHRDHISLELDIPAPERIELLGDAVNQFMLWHRRDIILTAAVPAAGSSTPSSSQARTVAASASPSPPGPPSPPNLASPLPFRSPPRQPTPPPLSSTACSPDSALSSSISTYTPICSGRTSAHTGRNSEKRKELAHVMSDSQKSVLAAQDELQSWLSADVPETYEYGKPFLPTYLMNNLPWEMRAMHEWYIKAYRCFHELSGPNGIFFLSLSETFTPSTSMQFMKLIELDHRLDTSIQQEYAKDNTPKKLEVATYLAIAMLAHADKDVLMVPYALTAHKYYRKRGGPSTYSIPEAVTHHDWLAALQTTTRNQLVRLLRVRDAQSKREIPEIPYIAQQINNGTTWNVGADLCRFLRRDVCNARGLFYDNKNELAMNDKFKPLREWEKEHMQ
ncbi:hydroxyproline-rich glycoprotein-like [Oryza sativa Japonica Group]|uniref:Hydroxyproline-rich glycoprotein-like n=1 Tax=Oryza sativa subsp. japonica TaxID=39947 RepID=Q5ZBF2_ORYSJ|nr:hydroxyproline-rich glycoprotein-like [Oryza sativa Japonica Group]